MFQDPRSAPAKDMSIIENIAVASARTAPLSFRFAITLISYASSRQIVWRSAKPCLEKRLQQFFVLLLWRQRQALALIMATLGPIKVLLLDEHTAARYPAAGNPATELTTAW